MNRIALLLIGVVALAGASHVHGRRIWTGRRRGPPRSTESKCQPNYRDWKLIAVDNLLVAGKTDQLRAQLGNDIAIKAFKEGKVPFPDGAIIAAIHWTRVRRKTTTKSWRVHFPELNRSLSDPR